MNMYPDMLFKLHHQRHVELRHAARHRSAIRKFVNAQIARKSGGGS